MFYSDPIVTMSWFNYIQNNFCFVYMFVLCNQPCENKAYKQTVSLIVKVNEFEICVTHINI